MQDFKFCPISDALPLDHTSLGICIDHQYSMAVFGETACKIYSCGGFTNAAFLIYQADYHDRSLENN
jgi:hypothetical protein